MAADPAAIESERRVDATLHRCCELGRGLIGAPAAECLDWLEP
jgi:hypothetical protein